MAIAMLISKSIKLAVAIFRREDFSIKIFTRDGDMPSDHSAIVSALTAMIGLINSLDSTVFAISLCLSLVVVHDAMNVRLSSGSQGLALNKLLAKNRQDGVDVVLGHEPAEVYMGILVGLLAAIITFLLF